MKKIIFVGASTPNLYGARILKEKGFNIKIYDKNATHLNSQIRRLPLDLLHKFDLFLNSKNEFEYVKLSEIKNHLAKGLDINYNSNLIIDLEKEEVSLNGELLQYDFLIMNTGHKEIEIDSKKFLFYNYSLDNPKEHFSGNSLMNSVEKIDKIIEIVNNINTK